MRWHSFLVVGEESSDPCVLGEDCAEAAVVCLARVCCSWLVLENSVPNVPQGRREQSVRPRPSDGASPVHVHLPEVIVDWDGLIRAWLSQVEKVFPDFTYGDKAQSPELPDGQLELWTRLVLIDQMLLTQSSVRGLTHMKQANLMLDVGEKRAQARHQRGLQVGDEEGGPLSVWKAIDDLPEEPFVRSSLLVHQKPGHQGEGLAVQYSMQDVNLREGVVPGRGKSSA